MGSLCDRAKHQSLRDYAKRTADEQGNPHRIAIAEATIKILRLRAARPSPRLITITLFNIYHDGFLYINSRFFARAMNL